MVGIDLRRAGLTTGSVAMKSGFYVGGFALLAAVAGLGLWLARSQRQELAAQVTRLSRQNADLRYELKQATQQVTDVGRQAVELDSQLGSAKVRSTATETRNVQLTRELTVREQREVALMVELAELRQRAAPPVNPENVEPVILPVLLLSPKSVAVPAVANLTPPPPVIAAPPPVDVEPYRQRIAELEQQLIDLLTRSLAEMPAEPPPTAIPSSGPRPHQVVRVGPADSFVVIDYGSEHGARPEAVIRLHRGTSALAQVQISDVRPRFSLAQVLPGTLKGQLQTGDLLVFTP